MKKDGFLKRGGLIYAITLCICAIALLVASARIQLSPLPERVAEVPTSVPGTVEAGAKITPKPTKSPTAAPTSAPTEQPAVPLGEMKLIMPVTGTVQKGFSGDSLVKSLTMRDWRVHRGADITAKEGTAVVAAADGTVTEIFFDDLYGISIRIDHGNGAQTIYQNLSTDTLVEEGQRVKGGEEISGVGDTATCEAKDSPHLHFELYVNGAAVDPMDYVKE